MYNLRYLSLILFLATLLSCRSESKKVSQSTHQDVPFQQDYSIKYYTDQETQAKQVYTDRNGKIQILSTKGLLHPYNGRFLYPGTLVTDDTYRFMKEKDIAALGLYDEQLVYLDNKAVLSNAWAGELYSMHQLPNAKLFAGAKDFTFLISDGKNLTLIQDSTMLWKGKLLDDEVIDLRSSSKGDGFWILGEHSLHTFSLKDQKLEKIAEGADFTAFDVSGNDDRAIIGTKNGYIDWDIKTGKQIGDKHVKLPWNEITAVSIMGENIWFGSTRGAFTLLPSGKFNYYAGERWLPGDDVIQITKGPKESALVLTTNGLAEIVFKKMTLHEKALFYENQVRSRHIRNGFNSTLSGMEKGNLSTGYLSDSDNDGLWTSLYFAGEIFRYAVTKDERALENCRESMDAMERLYTINPVPGFPARSFERRGKISDLSDPERWQHAEHPEWFWKATTSSDEVIGHIFAFGAMAELIDDSELKNRAVALIDTLMGHIVKNDLYLIDYDGKPTQWGKWNPDYVNSFPTSVGDRKLNSSNIIAMLQTAYHFTKKEIYKDKAFELIDKHGYLENLMRPMKEIGQAPDGSSDYSQMLSGSWNHSDDEMYFVGYWGLYRYAFNDSLKTKFKESILDHWNAEQPEKDGAWNIVAAITGADNTGQEEAIWYLQEYPLDMITWTATNSHRQDIELLEPNFRDQSTQEVLPPDELRISRHNANRFTLDGGSGGLSEYSAGDIWLFPYWMGRYLGVISGPVEK